MGKTDRIAAFGEGFCLLLLLAALITIQVLIAGTRLVYSLPSYAAIGLLGLVAVFFIRRSKPTPDQFCLAASTLFLGYILIRACFSPAPFVARSDIYSVLAGLIVYFFTACILTNARQRMVVIGGLLILAFGHVFIGALQFRDGQNYMPISWLQRYDYENRASGFYICPNHLAGLLEVLGIFGLSLVCWSRLPVWAKLLVAYAVGVCYLGVILTGSRGGYLSAGTSLFVFAVLSLAVLRRTSSSLFSRAAGLGLISAIILGSAAVYFVNRSPYLSGRAQMMIDSKNVRLDLWEAALDQWKLQPLIGTGSGTHQYYGRFFRRSGMQRDPLYVHNDYLHLLAEYGIAGAAGMALFLFAHVRKGLQSFARIGPRRVAVSQRTLSNALALNLAAIAAVSSYLVHSVFDFNLHIPANLLLMAFVFGLLANDGVMRERDRLSPPSRAFLWRGMLPALGLVLLVQAVRLFPGEYLCEHARTAVRDNRPALAVREAQRGLQYNPHNPDLYFYLGLARMELGARMEDPVAASSFHREGIRAFERARALLPQEQFYALELGFAFDAERRFEEGEWHFFEALRLDPNSTSLRRYYESHLQNWRKPEPAQKNASGDGS